MDDIALLQDYAAGKSEDAFNTLVSRRVAFVYSAALRQVRDPHLAQEVTQAVFIILAQKAGRISRKTVLTGWLFKTTRYAAMAQIRAAVKRREREQEAQMQTEINRATPDPAWEQMAPILDEALASLRETDRQAILLRFFENKDLREVGNTLKTSEDTARKRVARALERLRKYFSKHGVVSTSAIIAESILINSVQNPPLALVKSVTMAAIAKNTGISSSTVTLVTRALKLMAWTKVQTAIVVGVGALLAVGTTARLVEKTNGNTFVGTLIEIFPLAPSGPQTNFYNVLLRSRPPNWELSLTSSNRNYRAFASSKQTFEVDIYDAPIAGPLNTATIYVYPVPKPIRAPAATHVWLALLSGNSLIDRRLPIPDPGLGGIAEPCLVIKANGTRDDISPRYVQWTNEFPAGRTVYFKGEFNWQASTNFGGKLNIPAVSQMACYIVDATGNRKNTWLSELTITNVETSQTAPREIPRIPGRNVIFDYRLSDLLSFEGREPPKMYEVYGGNGLERIPSDK